MAKKQSQKRQQKQQQQQQQQQQGGAGAAEHALQVYGNMNDQRAASPNDNTIAMRPASGMQGGSLDGKKSKQQLQNIIKKQLQQLQQQQKQQGGGLAFSDYAASPAAPAAAPADTKASIPVQKGGQDIDAVKMFSKVGGKMSKQQLQQLAQQLQQQQQQQQQGQQGGVGLTEVLAPLILLYTSQKYGKGKTAKPHRKSMRRTMRKSRKLRR
jgi:hypothetical protein